MIDASLSSVRVDRTTKQALDDVMRDDGYIADVERDDYYLAAGVTWKRSRQYDRNRRRGAR